MSRQLESCPECKYQLIDRTTYCPYCGTQLTHPPWKKVAAWFILILIAWGLVKCHLRLFQGLEGFFEEDQPNLQQTVGEFLKEGIPRVKAGRPELLQASLTRPAEPGPASREGHVF